MQRYHPTELRVGTLLNPAAEQLLLMAAGDAEFNKTQQPNPREQGQIKDDAQVHCNSSISALKPGPNAASRPRSPGRISPRASHSCKTNSTEALERLP